MTYTTKVPAFAPPPVVAVISVGETTETLVAAIAPDFGPLPWAITTMSPVAKPLPVSVMLVPPVVGPLLGLTEATVVTA